MRKEMLQTEEHQSVGLLKDVLLKMTPNKSFSLKVFIKLSLLVLESKVLVYPDALFRSLSVTDVK